jgi:hypothetical protein
MEQLSEWPGTKLLSGTARVYSFDFDNDVAGLLRRAASGLFDWQQPLLPEDLALLRDDGSPWLTTIAHEHDAFLSLSEDEIGKLAVECGELASVVARPPTSG